MAEGINEHSFTPHDFFLKIVTFAIVLAFLNIFGLLSIGAPCEGCNGTPGSGVTVCTGLCRFAVNKCKLANLLSHMEVTSAILCTTCKKN